ncbi:MAG: crossover junction endodeoxyribonuclease RuvC [Candidatus Pacebacteria bacterium RIFCSPHIGHO2_01_FULL_46_16]|nr:MAG: crossover junction endodeoxyribonuclease RuvC [Candidatus Pacebacteria bacterium RIFCSPHIGHO2_01_FULL_46_16]
MTTIIAIDPGYDRLGWTVVTVDQRKLQLLAYDCIITDRTHNLVQRMSAITAELTALIEQYRPDELAIETLFFARNTTTALKVSEIRGAVIATAIAHNIAVAQYNPMTIKQSVTGHGKADKRGVSKMLRLLFPEIGQVAHDDTMDAIAVAVTHALTAHQIQL